MLTYENMRKDVRVRRAFRNYLTSREHSHKVMDLIRSLELHPKDHRYYEVNAQIRAHMSGLLTGKRCDGCRKAYWREEIRGHSGYLLKCPEGKRLEDLRKKYGPEDPPEIYVALDKAADNRSQQRISSIFKLVGPRGFHILVDTHDKPEREENHRKLREATALIKNMPRRKP